MKKNKILYFNTETINSDALESSLKKDVNYLSHIEIKPGLLLVSFQGSAKNMYDILSNVINENSILIYDLDNSEDAYWGYMNKNIWDWIKANNN